MPFIEANIGIRSTFQVEGGRELPPDEAPRVYLSTATPGYFPAMGIELLEGRLVDELDQADRPPVALVNQALARAHGPAAARSAATCCCASRAKRFAPKWSASSPPSATAG
jgi:hypothetical protein